VLEAYSHPTTGMRCGQAGGRPAPRLSLSDRPTLAPSPPLVTVTLLNHGLWKLPPTPCTRYVPGGRSLASKRPCSRLTTMKVRRFSSFFSFTKAPATGCPDASLMTPVTVPLFCADAPDEAAINTAPVAIPTARIRVTFLRDMDSSLWLPA